MKIIYYYTKDTPYEDQANILKKSLDKFKLSYHGYAVENLHSWEKNCGQKATIIERALNDFPNENIFYLDADAEVVREPVWGYFKNVITPAFIIIKFEHEGNRWWELVSNSMYFPNNQLSRAVVKAWKQTQEKYPDWWDQKTLQAVVDQNKVPFVSLHHDWGYIPKHMVNRDNPIVLQYQISNILKEKINVKSTN